jgi:YihY family inner membrane protein
VPASEKPLAEVATSAETAATVKTAAPVSTAGADTAAPAETPKPLAETSRALVRLVWPTARFLMTTEVHTFAFSVAANAILSFFPFFVLLLTITRRVFHSQAMFDTVVQLLRAYLPTGQDFVIRNLKYLVSAHRGVEVFSVVMLLITSTGVFLPLEVALNKVWGFKKDRPYLGNQVISLALAVACGLLALISIALTAGNTFLLQRAFGAGPSGWWQTWVIAHLSWLVMKACAIPVTISIFFLIYWLLPNGKVPARAVLPAAVVVGLLWEVAKYAYVLALPRLNFQEVYGPFSISVTLMFWAFLSGLLLLAGAHLSASGRASGK